MADALLLLALSLLSLSLMADTHGEFTAIGMGGSDLIGQGVRISIKACIMVMLDIIGIGKMGCPLTINRLCQAAMFVLMLGGV